jgi:putative peptidoglycan binding protein
MKRVLYSVCIGSLALALTAWGAQVNDRRPDRAKAQRTSHVRATKPANTGGMMGAHRNISTASYRQRAHVTPRTSSHAVVNRDARMRAYRERNLSRNQDVRARSNVAVNRERNLAVNRTRNVDINRHRNTDELRARNGVTVNRERELAVNRTRNVDVNRHRDTDQFRARNNLAVNRNRNVAANRTQNFAYYRGGNARINNNFRSAAFRGQQYTVFRNYHRQWHDRDWWRSHCDRIVFVSGGWYYWNAGYWFPAWGYDPYASYAYDGPIYAYNGLTPDQVIVDVQEQLQRAGYYDGPIDGILGPMTREAIAAFQADNGLAVTSVIDEPTLATLGIA